MRIVTERTKMAMPEVNIGLFPDVGGSHFLSRAPGELGAFLALTGETIGAADALYAGLADAFIPAVHLPALWAMIETIADSAEIAQAIHCYAEPYRAEAAPESGMLASHRTSIDRHFALKCVPGIMESLKHDTSVFASKVLAAMQQRSPLMMCVTLSQIRRSAQLGIGDCLRMEHTMVRRCFEHGEVLEGIRALAIDKDNSPRWNTATLDEVTPAVIARFFEPAWPDYAHPSRALH